MGSTLQRARDAHTADAARRTLGWAILALSLLAVVAMYAAVTTA